MPTPCNAAATTPGGGKEKEPEPPRAVAEKSQPVSGGRGPPKPKAKAKIDLKPKSHPPTTTTKSTEKKKIVRGGLTKMERELIAKLKSKTETKLGDSGFPLGKRANLSGPFPRPISAQPTPIIIPVQPRQQSSYPPQLVRIGTQPQTLNSHIRPQLTLQRKPSSTFQPQHAKAKIARPQLPTATARTVNHAANKPPPPQTVPPQRQQKKPALPTKQQRKATPNPPAQPKSKIASSSSQQKLQKLVAAAPKPKPKFRLPTQQQKSLADRRRREARKETPITLNEVDMNEKEIVESKRLLACFLSGRDAPPLNETATETTAVASGTMGYNNDDATKLYVDRYQHDPSNHSTPYHYSVPSSQKRAKGSSDNK